jgi:polyisoprenyl-phosphate glycosyltransferase
MNDQVGAQGPELSIVVAVFNEESTIGAFMAACDAVIPTLQVSGHEFVFVDDGSTDETWSILRALSQARDDVVAIRLVHNVGKEAALTAGLVAASGEAQVPMDVDLQDPPEVLVDLVREWRAGHEVVLARRSERADGPGRRAAARVVYGTLSRGARDDIPVDVGDFRLMSRTATRRFLSFRERGRYNKGLFALSSSGDSVVEYRRPAGVQGRRSRQSPMRLARLTVDGVVSFSTWPLQLLSLLGFVLLALSVVALVLGVVLRATNVLEVPGQATVVVLVAFVLGFQALSMGVLGLYVAQILTEVKRRPLYFVADSAGTAPDVVSRVDDYSIG